MTNAQVLLLSGVVAVAVFSAGALAAVVLGSVDEAVPTEAAVQPSFRPEQSAASAPWSTLPQRESNLRWGFQLPSGNIACIVDGRESPASASCVIRKHGYEPPPSLPTNCASGAAHRFDLVEGQRPEISCVVAPADFGMPVQDYGRPVSAGSITCIADSRIGISCTDSTSGHFFRVSRETASAG